MFSEEISFPIGEIDGEKIGGCGDVHPAISDRAYSIECWADEALAQPTALPSAYNFSCLSGFHTHLLDVVIRDFAA